MLNLLTFKSINSLYKDNYWSELPKEQTLVIVPSPSEADLLRSQLGHLEIVSISNFLQNHSRDFEVLKKSELMKLLSEIWIKTGQDQNFNLFKMAFDYFTEIRNNTNDFDSFSSVVETLAKEQQSFYYHSYSILEEHDFYDESRLVRELKERVSAFTKDRYVFWGFKFFNSNQIDFLNELSRTKNIAIGIPHEVLSESSHLDWVNWLVDYNVLELGAVKGEKPVNNYIENLSFKRDFLKNQEGNILSVNSFDLEWIQSLGSEVYFKVEQDYFNLVLIKLRKKLKTYIGKKHKDLKLSLKGLLDNMIQEHRYKEIKVLSLIITQLEKSSENKDFSYFDFHLFISILDLDLPRIFLVNFNEHHSIYALDELLYIGDKEVTCFYESEKTHTSNPFWNLPNETLKALGAIGAIKNTRFEELYEKFYKEELFFDKTKKLLIDQKLYLENKNIQIFLDGEKISRWERESFPLKTTSYITLASGVKSERKYHSATSLQAYLDCPRKFYFKYQTKLTKPLDSLELLGPLERGRFEHQGIEKFITEQVLEVDIRSWYDRFFLEFFSNKSVEFKDFSSMKEISFQRIFNGVKFTRELLDQFEEPQIYFEKEITSLGYIGSIDLHIIGKNQEAIIDYKSGASSIPTVKGIIELKKIQTVFYADKVVKKDNFMVGYFNLTSPKDSRILSTFSYEMLGKSKRANKNLSETVEKYHDFEKGLIEKISLDRAFVAHPQDETSCSYCEFRNICLERR